MEQVPSFVPILSRGRHRNPRRGGCFMEIASFFAGEKWSDHPVCTHPVLASIARNVNDFTSDIGRPALAPLIPEVIGTDNDDPRIGPSLVALCARETLPDAPPDRQRVLAAALVAAEYLLVPEHRHEDIVEFPWATRQVLLQVPDAARWAIGYVRAVRLTDKAYTRFAAPRAVEVAVATIAPTPDPVHDERLRGLLRSAIDETCRITLPAPVRQAHSWAAACDLVGSTTL